jgi:drug/metabolite transporter (DMT)-like permease
LSKKDWLKFWGISLLWGSHYLWIKIALRETEPVTMVALRLLSATAAILVFHRITRPKYPQKTPWLSFLFLGLFNLSVPFALIAWSETHITSGMASILSSTSPLFTMLLSWVFLREEAFSLTRLVGLMFGFGGVIILVSENLSTKNSGFYLGAAAVLLAAISYAFAAIYAKRYTSHLHYSVQALGQVMIGAAVALPASVVIGAPFTLPRLPQTWAAILIMGLVLTAIGANLFFSLLNSVGPTRTLMVSYLYPLVGVLLGIVFLGEQPTWQLLSGGGLIVGGVILANSRHKIQFRIREKA